MLTGFNIQVVFEGVEIEPANKKRERPSAKPK
jgi:hypothetical protein